MIDFESELNYRSLPQRLKMKTLLSLIFPASNFVIAPNRAAEKVCLSYVNGAAFPMARMYFSVTDAGPQRS